MAISFTRYVDITSGVGATSQVARRDLIGRLFTTNPLLPTGSMIDFTNAAEVGAYFGTSSEEYARAVFYFSWISKNITAPQKITYARWVDADVAPEIYGNIEPQVLSTYTAITSGSFSMTIGGVTNNFTGIDFSTATSLTDVASIIQAEINGATGVQWTAATVTYNAVRGSFDFVGGDAVVAMISVTEGVSGTPIAGIIGWLAGAIFSYGALTETITETLTNSTNASNNFGSFLFMPTLTLDQITEAATWNYTNNVMFMYMVPIADKTLAATYLAALGGFGGTGVTYSVTSGEYPEMFPMMIEAATDYNAANSVQNYMYQQTNLTPSVTNDTDANLLDTNKINYYGVTQTAGQFVAFYQRGVLMGVATSPSDMNVYANEAWLKDAAGAAIMTLLLTLAKVSANDQGRSQILAILQSIINQAVNNGTISVGKPLSDTQKLYISTITGDPNAWYQVQTIGYWLDCVIESYVAIDSSIEYKAVYSLVYSKDDDIRKVEGQHVLI